MRRGWWARGSGTRSPRRLGAWGRSSWWATTPSSAPLSAGGLWPALAADGPVLQEIQRTKVRWQRTAWDQLREGKTATALGAYARHGHLTVSGTRAEAVTNVVEAWNADGRSGLIVTDASNAECHTVNLAAQAARHRAGELGAEALLITTAHGELALH